MAIGASKLYGFAQTALLGIFAAVVFFAPVKPLLLTGKTPGLAGDVFCFVGLFLLFAGINRLGRAIQIDPAPRTDASLVTVGIYQWFRHPIYTGLLLAFVGSAVAIGEWRGILSVALALLAFVLKVRVEEVGMRKTFAEYERYQRTTAALIPFVL